MLVRGRFEFGPFAPEVEVCGVFENICDIGPADTARHLRTLGEVEALVVHSVDITADPASVLGLDLPIYSLDGKAATPHVWAAMLCARIATDVVPVSAPPRRPARTVRQ